MREVICIAVVGIVVSCVNLAQASEVAASAEEVCPIKAGMPLPALSLANLDGEPFDVNAAVAEKPVVMIVYRGGWCRYCNAHTAALEETVGDLRDMGYRVMGVSMDSPMTLRKAQKHAGAELPFEPLSDSRATAAQALGLAFKVDDKTYELYTGYGINLEAASGEGHHILPVPAVLVVGKDGVIDFIYVNTDYKVRLSPKVLLAAAEAAFEK